MEQESLEQKQIKKAIEKFARESSQWPMVSVPGPQVAAVSKNRADEKLNNNKSDAKTSKAEVLNRTYIVMTDQPIITAKVKRKDEIKE